MRSALALLFVLGCHHDPATNKPGDLPPLPPASGTPVGYLIDSAGELKLRDDQLKQLKDIDQSLAARDAGIDVQLRQIERPEQDEADPTPQEQKAGKKRGRHNNAPGAAVMTNGDSQKLHAMRNANDRDALKQAWVLLDPDQQSSAKKILEDRGVEAPGSDKKPGPVNDPDGQPLPGMEP